MGMILKKKNLPFEKGYFWFYGDNDIIASEVIIQQVLILGNLKEIFDLLNIYGVKKCRKVFTEKITLLGLDGRYSSIIIFLDFFLKIFENEEKKTRQEYVT